MINTMRAARTTNHATHAIRALSKQDLRLVYGGYVAEVAMPALVGELRAADAGAFDAVDVQAMFEMMSK